MEASLAGYSALIDLYDLPVPLHHEMAAISPKNTRRKEDGWAIYPASLRPPSNPIDHLVFALKYEGINLLTLKKIFQSFEKKQLEQAALSKPTSAYFRRLCFLYEWLLNDALDLPDVVAGAYVEAIDPRQQYGSEFSANDKRFRVRDNLPGSPTFCPLVFRTKKLDEYIALNLSDRAQAIVDNAPRELVARAAAFLLLSDSKASFAIEGENPPKDRIARWGNVIGKAGSLRLSLSELVRLQRELIGDDRFVRVGLREEGGFVGRHDSFGQPEPEHISANADDLEDLIEGIIRFNGLARSSNFDPVLTSACVSFGFVYVHPFEDGNGRIHRFLMHHVLAERGYTPKEIIFPISSAIFNDIARYKDVLEGVSRGVLEFIEWSPTERGNVEVHNATSDYYRYFDATAHCEYLFKCLEKVVDDDLPKELAFLAHRDEFHRRVTHVVDMGERTLDLLLRFLRQNRGVLSRRAREGEFEKLVDEEVAEIEEIYASLFD